MRFEPMSQEHFPGSRVATKPYAFSGVTRSSCCFLHIGWRLFRSGRRSVMGPGVLLGDVATDHRF